MQQNAIAPNAKIDRLNINYGPHSPVMLAEVLAALAPQAGKIYIDATYGRGGYSRAILEIQPGCRLIALDRDPEAVAHAQKWAADAKEGARFTIIEGKFSDLSDKLDEAVEAGQIKAEDIDGIVFDFGVSSPQLDQGERGFSFRTDGPLDMRMGKDGTSAADIVNKASEKELTRIFKDYGEEPAAKRIARAICARRVEDIFTRTADLADLIRANVKGRGGKGAAIDPATRSFQGLRIAVNEELDEINAGLSCAAKWIANGGKLVAVSFHSLEDRLVKTHILNAGPANDNENPQKPQTQSRHAPPVSDQDLARYWRSLYKKPIAASAAEAKENPRARSAKLRAGVRTATTHNETE